MNDVTYLNNQLLIAMPNLADPSFSHTVTYLCQHNDEGALGIVINRLAQIKLGEIFQQLNIEPSTEEIARMPVFSGGPVQQDRGFVIHLTDGQWESSIETSSTLSLTASRDILEAIAHGQGPEQFLIALGYAGWGKGQLEQEITQNAWLNVPFGSAILFDTPINQRWDAAASQIGIDINQLTMPAGHG